MIPNNQRKQAKAEWDIHYHGNRHLCKLLANLLFKHRSAALTNVNLLTGGKINNGSSHLHYLPAIHLYLPCLSSCCVSHCRTPISLDLAFHHPSLKSGLYQNEEIQKRLLFTGCQKCPGVAAESGRNIWSWHVCQSDLYAICSTDKDRSAQTITRDKGPNTHRTFIFLPMANQWLPGWSLFKKNYR